MEKLVSVLSNKWVAFTLALAYSCWVLHSLSKLSIFA